MPNCQVQGSLFYFFFFASCQTFNLIWFFFVLIVESTMLYFVIWCLFLAIYLLKINSKWNWPKLSTVFYFFCKIQFSVAMRKSDITLIISTLSSFWNSSLNQLLKIMFTLINSIWNVLSMLRSQSIIGNLFSCFILFILQLFFYIFMLIQRKHWQPENNSSASILNACVSLAFTLALNFCILYCNKRSTVMSHVQRAYWKYSTFLQ